MPLELGAVYGRGELVKLNAGAAASRQLRLVQLTRSPLAYGFETVPGRRYVVESTDDLQKWEPMETHPGSGGVVRFTPEAAPGTRPRFFRVRVE